MSTSKKGLQCLCDCSKCQNKHYCSYPTRQRHRAICGLLSLSSSATSTCAQQMHMTSTAAAHPSRDAGCTTEPLFTDDTVTGMVITVVVDIYEFLYLILTSG